MATETKAAALRSKSAQELKDELVELRKEEFNLRMQRGTGQLSNTARFKEIRREVARIKTILNEQAASAKASA
ncbi:MAG: 50S ribosomal protein L29 [Gammaproteobacteria bacterium]|nr:50S ribosomal protein L29 [Gammaproteobacteria bacterium]